MFHLKKIPKCFGMRCRLLSCSQAKPLVGLSLDNEGIATLQLQRAPVNSFNLELLQALQESICEVEKNNCKGVVLTSEFPKIFSAGLDLNEFRKPDQKKFSAFIKSLFDVLTKIYGTDIITTAAINGYTGAGGCVFALAFDYRTMTTGPATIGLNDTAVGIPPAMWLFDLMSRVIGPKQAEYALTSSVMYPAERALQVGLIDYVAADKMDAIEKCKAFIRTYDHIPWTIRAATKRAIRQEYLTRLEKQRLKYTTDTFNLINTPEFQEMFDRYIQSIKQRKATKALGK